MTDRTMMRGRFFATEQLPGGDVRITWSETDPDPTKWDGLDFWIVPAPEVGQRIGEVHRGVVW